MQFSFDEVRVSSSFSAFFDLHWQNKQTPIKGHLRVSREINFIKTLFVFLLFLLVRISVSAQFSKFELKQITQEHGLPGVTVRQLFQDSKGLFWIGVESYGLCKYDGYDFELFAPNPDDTTSISNNVVESICEDVYGNIWVGTQNGLNILDRQTKHFARILKKENSPHHIPGNTVLSLAQTVDNNIWIGTESGAAIYFEKQKIFKHILVEPGIKNTISQIKQTSDGTIWLASNTGVYGVDSLGNVLKHIAENDFLASNYTQSIEEYSDSCILIGEGMNLYKYNFISGDWKKVQIVSKVARSSGDYITDIHKDKNGVVWVSTTTDGISILSKDLSIYKNIRKDESNSDGLISSAVRDIYEDAEGLIWFGLKFEGLQFFNYRTQAFEYFPQDENKLESKNIISIYEYDANTILIGTSKGGIYVFNPNSQNFRHIISNEFKSINNARINAFVKDKDGDVWFGTSEFLYKADKQFQNFKKYNIGGTIDIIKDGAERIWIGTRNGAYVIDNNSIMTFAEYSNLNNIDSSFAVKTLFEDSRQNIWIGTLQNGLFLFDSQRNSIRHFEYSKTNENGISGNFIRYIHEDKSGRIWITTRGQGLNMFSYADSSFVHYTERDGLPSNTLFGILEDTLQNLWITSYQGLCKFNYNTKQTENYTKEYGLQNDIFEPNATCLSSEGVMYIGGDNGFNRFSPYQIAIPKKKPSLIITSIKVLNEERWTDVDSTIDISLPYDQNYIGFDFSLLDFSSNIGKRYSYKLEGIDEQWIHTRSRHFANYTNLPPGDYTFQLKARTKDGVDNYNSVSVNVHIDSPFWKKVWFQIAISLVVGLIIYIVVTFRLKQERKRNQILKLLVEEKTAHLQEQQEILIAQKMELEDKTLELEESNFKLQDSNHAKNTLVSVIAHDLKNQFHSIIGFSSTLIQSTQTVSENFHKYAKLIYASSISVNTVLDNMLNWYKSQSSELRPNIENVDLHSIVKDVVNDYALSALDKKIDIQIQLLPHSLIKADIQMLRSIVRNLLNNAIKFSNENGVIKIIGQQDDDNYLLSVQDGGCGMSSEDTELVFLSNNTNRSTSGYGLGLQICKEFAVAMDGNITVESEKGEGSTFTLVLKFAEDDPSSKTTIQSGHNASIDEDLKEIKKQDLQILKKKKILIIDDNIAILEYLDNFLSRYSTVLKAADGEEGYSIAVKELPDLIITDLVMPRKDGIELTTMLRNEESCRHIPILLLTAQNYDNIIEQAYVAGISDFIPKPFDEKVLVLKIKNLFHLKAAIKYMANVSLVSDIAEDVEKDSLLQQIMDVIYKCEDYSNLNVESLASDLGMSKSTLIRKLKNETKKAPSEIISDVKFEKAKQLLSTKKFTISEVAWTVGFTEVKYFSKKFKQQFGMTPSEFMKG